MKIAKNIEAPLVLIKDSVKSIDNPKVDIMMEQERKYIK